VADNLMPRRSFVNKFDVQFCRGSEAKPVQVGSCVTQILVQFDCGKCILRVIHGRDARATRQTAPLPVTQTFFTTVLSNVTINDRKSWRETDD
jgi:hypothetical protein